MQDFVRELDVRLFNFIHHDLANSLFDLIFPYITDMQRISWVSFGLIPLLLAFWVFKKRKQAVGQIFVLVLALAITDMFSHHVLKQTFQRQRPLQSGLAVEVKTVPHSGFSFPSNHAANNFAAATVLAHFFPPATVGLFVYAGLMAFSRIYVGVHFPLDVFFGSLLGLLIAGLVLRARHLILSRFRRSI